MAKPTPPTIAFFRCRANDKAPLFEAKFPFDAAEMRKHPEYFECNAEGVALDGVSVAECRHKDETAVETAVEAVLEEVAVVAKPKAKSKK